ncbi:MAG: hypothetical protein GF364_06445 [Candidatus Lokiarchaeota archaeon]|nr:hypothetical protein [Candidatus Lokiarchaeota archaeon]
MMKELWLFANLILFIFSAFISGFFFLQAKKNKQVESLRKYCIGIGIFMLFVALNGAIDVSTMYVTEVLGKYDLFPEEQQFLTYGKNSFYIIITLLMVGFSVLSYQIESHITRSQRHTLTIVLVVCFFISLIPYFGFLIPDEYHKLVKNIVYGTQVPFTLIIIYWGVFYLSLARKSAGIVKRKALMVAFGLGFLFFGIIVDTMYRWVRADEFIVPFAVRCISIVGAILLLFGFKREEF